MQYIYTNDERMQLYAITLSCWVIKVYIKRKQ